MIALFFLGVAIDFPASSEGWTARLPIDGSTILADAGGPYFANEGEEIEFNATESQGPPGVSLRYRWDFDGDGVWDTSFSNSPYANHTWHDDHTGTAYVEVSGSGGENRSLEIVGEFGLWGFVKGQEQRGQSFVSPFDVLTHVEVDVARHHQETPDAPLVLAIRSDVNDTDLASAHVDGAGMPRGVENWVTFDIPDLPVNQGNQYFVVLYSNAQNAGYEVHASMDVYPNGSLWGKGPGGGWVPSPYVDLRIVVSGTVGMVSDTDEASVTVYNVPPTPEWTSESSDGTVLNPPYPEGKEILFEATVDDPGIYDTFTYDWDFGDGTILLDAGPLVTHTYGDNDLYMVVLTVMDDDGGVGVDDTPPLATTNEDPAASINMPYCIFTEGTSPCSPKGEFTDPGWLDTHAAVWNYGDGTYETAVLTEENDPPDATGMNITSHIYGDNGVYNITFTIADDDGGVGTAWAEAQVINLPPTLEMNNPSPVNEGEDFVLGIIATDPGSDDIILTIDWGDGALETMTYYNDGVGSDPPNSGEGVYPFVVTASLTHVYGDNGNFPIQVKAEDDDGDSVQDSTVAEVLNLPPEIMLLVVPTYVNENEEFTLVAEATDQGSDDIEFTWTFKLGPSMSTMFYNDGVGSDPPMSPWGIFPFTAEDTATHTYGDNGLFNVTITATDDDGGVTVQQVTVTVNNVAPSVGVIEYYLNASFAFRIAGEKWHNVEIHLYEDGTEIGYANITRYPGSPNEQMVTLADISIDFSKTYSAVAYYTPEDDPINGQIWGATPAWVILEYEDGEERIHHTFNVRHEDTWTWVIDDFSPHFLGHNITFTATASDPGSDDLTFTWNWGDGSITENIYYNDGIGPDPYPSPEVNATTVTDTVGHGYSSAGTYVITLTVTDDDGGVTSYSLNLTL